MLIKKNKISIIFLTLVFILSFFILSTNKTFAQDSIGGGQPGDSIGGGQPGDSIGGGQPGDSIGGGSPGTTSVTRLDNPLTINTIWDFVEKILNIVVSIGIPIVAFFIILSGFRFVSARGNPEALGEAKRMLLYTLIGAVLLLGAWVIAQAISGTVDLITKP